MALFQRVTAVPECRVSTHSQISGCSALKKSSKLRSLFFSKDGGTEGQRLRLPQRYIKRYGVHPVHGGKLEVKDLVPL